MLTKCKRFIIEHYPKMTKRQFVLIALYSGALSLAIILSGRIVCEGSRESYLVNVFLGISFGAAVTFFVLCPAIFCALTYLTTALNRWLSKPDLLRTNSIRLSNRRFFFLCALSLSAFWGVHWLTYFPGAAFYDIFYILSDPAGISGQHPFFYNFLLAGIFAIGKAVFGDINGGMALYSLVQMLLMSISVSYCLLWMKRQGCHKAIIIVVWCYYALSAFFSSASILITKDVIFSAAMLLYVPLLHDIYLSEGLIIKDARFIIKLAAVSLIAVFIRNNGAFIVAAIIICLFFFYRKRSGMIKPLAVFALIGFIAPLIAANFVMGY